MSRSGSGRARDHLPGGTCRAEEVADGIWAVNFYTYLLGHLNERERHVYGIHLRQHTPPPDR